MSYKKGMVITTIVLGVLLGILAIGTLDYTVSLNIINRHSHFGEFFNRFGELPAILGLVFSITILYGSRKREKVLNNTVSSIFSIPFLLLFSFMTIFMPIRYVYEFSDTGVPESLMIIIYILSAILFITSVIVVHRFDAESVRKLKKPALVMLILIVSEMVLVNVLKIIWGRPRMRSIDSIEQFRYWYQLMPPAAGQEFKSFPSGHTANGFVMVAWSLFIPQGKFLLKKWAIPFGLTWGFCVALSRILLGAHFLSDVIVGGYITVLLFYLLSNIILKERK